MQNCGGHGVKCSYAQTCDAGSCVSRPCNYSTTFSERSPGLCVDNHMLVCGNSGTYYYDSKNGNCTEESPCTVCPDGFAGCASDKSAFCANHQKKPDDVPTTCVENAYPPFCAGNTGYICGSNNKYYTTANTRCSGTDQCVLCQSGFIGCSSDPKAFCNAKNSEPVIDADKCTPGHRRCDGRTLMECDGTSYSKLVETCARYCVDGSSGSNSECSDYFPECTIKNGSRVRVIGWNDGDTVVVQPDPDDNSCDNYAHFSIRVYRVDSPECSKSQNYKYSNIKTCTQDTNYTSTNDPYGYDAWQASTAMADAGTFVTLYCDNADEYGVCPTDANGRPLAYVSVGNKDISTELTRLGLAIPSLGRVPPQSEREATICDALFEAVKERRKIWSVCSTNDGQCIRDGAATLKSTRSGEFDYIYERCQYISGVAISETPVPSCTPGKDLCSDGKLYFCTNNGDLSFVKDCPYGCADSSTCVTSQQISCTPGQSVCLDSKMYYCDENSDLVLLKECYSECINDSVCSIAPGLEYCINNKHFYWT